MKLFNQILLATGLTFAAFFAQLADAHAHEIKIGKIVIHHPWIKAAPNGAAVAGGFTTIDNTGDTDDKLVKATVEGVPLVQIHEMKMDGDTMKMRELAGGLVIPAGKSVALKPGSFHIMLMNLKSQFMPGQVLKGTMTFEKAGTVDVDFEVVAPGGEVKPHDHTNMKM